jgi:hypothetical protein
VPIASVEALVGAAKVLVISVEALTTSSEALITGTDVAGLSGYFFDFLLLPTSLSLVSLSSRANFLGIISTVLISCFIPNFAAIF